MTYRDMKNDLVDIQCDKTFCYYDYENNERIVITEDQANELEIKYLYTEKDIIFIEVEFEQGL